MLQLQSGALEEDLYVRALLRSKQFLKRNLHARTGRALTFVLHKSSPFGDRFVSPSVHRRCCVCFAKYVHYVRPLRVALHSSLTCARGIEDVTSTCPPPIARTWLPHKSFRTNLRFVRRDARTRNTEGERFVSRPLRGTVARTCTTEGVARTCTRRGRKHNWCCAYAHGHGSRFVRDLFPLRFTEVERRGGTYVQSVLHVHAQVPHRSSPSVVRLHSPSVPRAHRR